MSMPLGDRILIGVDGKAGQPGTQFYDARDTVAPPGRNGEHGRSASAATAGTNAGTVSIEITPSRLEPGGIHVVGTTTCAGSEWEVSADKTLFLSARGGDGGAGGRGEDGQMGGAGIKGENASEYAEAQAGGPGANGGDAGYGTDGGNGGNGGVVFIEVAEQNTDLLLGVDWDISGGMGGASGVHGNRGEGGKSGEGGDQFTWQVYDGIGYSCCGGAKVCTCSKFVQTNKYISYTRPVGPPGPYGMWGSLPSTDLKPGSNGAQGSVHIKVKSSNGMDSIYHGKYFLKITSFEIVDAGNDGVFEPGEHIIVRNICVQNIGGMPSPAHARIPVLIRSTAWFDPLIDEPAYLPNSIFPGETVSIRGEVRAFIRQEGQVRPPGVIFQAVDQLDLVAIMPGINRALPEFFQPVAVSIGYPLELEAPSYLSSVQRGNDVTFSWMLRNISNKPYGIKGALRRAGGTCLSEIGDNQLFKFTENNSNDNRHRGIDLPDIIAPGAVIMIAQTLKVSDRADQYSIGALTLELLLSEPGDKADWFSTLPSPCPPLRSIITYSLEVQISARYSYNPSSAFLIVVNSETKSETIHQLYRLMGDLKTSADVWNLSVYGSFISPTTGKCILLDYIGKTIVIFGNPFEYFRQGMRSAFGLIDPFVVAHLAAAGTNFLFPETVSGDASLSSWFSHLYFPTYVVAPETQAIDRKILIPTINCEQRNRNLDTHIFIAKTQLLKKNKIVLVDETKRTAKSLDDHLPLHRFSVSPVTSISKKIAGTVIVRQGLPRYARVVAAYGYWHDFGDRLSDLNTFMMIASLPFKTRVKIFWNKFSGYIPPDPAGDMYDVSVFESTTNKPILNPSGVVELDSGDVSAITREKSGKKADNPLSRAQIDEKIYKALALSLNYEMEQEISRFCAEAPWPDPIPENNCLYQVSKVDYFLTVAVNASKAELPSDFQLLVETLGCLVAGIEPVGAGQYIGQKMVSYGKRRSHLRLQIFAKLDVALRSVYAEKVAAKIKRKLMRESDKLKNDMGKTEEKTLMKVIMNKCGALTNENFASHHFLDASAAEGKSEAWAEHEAATRMTNHAELLTKIRMDELYSREILEKMVRM